MPSSNKQFITLLMVLIGNANVGNTQAFSFVPSKSLTHNNNLARHRISHSNVHSHYRQEQSRTISTRQYMKNKKDEINTSRPTRFDKRNQQEKNKDDSLFGLSAASIATDMDMDGNVNPTKNMDVQSIIESISGKATEAIPDSLGKVLGAALLITSNTVGASMMVLPGLASGPGMVVSSGVLIAVYLTNLFSGLLIAEVAINQYQTSACDVPSSFKEFADVNLKSNSAGTFIAIISVFVNMCVLAFDFVRGGQLITENQQLGSILAPLFGSDILNSPTAEHGACALAAGIIIAMVGTQSSETLSKVASLCCITLFVSFAGLVLPGIASIDDPLAVFMAPGTSPIGSPDFLSSLSTFIPIALMTGIYQNIVPTITKTLNYDRAQVVSAISLGAFFPMLMYISFCFTEIGSSGAATALSTGGIFMTGIRMSSLIGSASAGVTSVAQELELFFGDKEKKPSVDQSALFADENVDMLNVKSEEACLADKSKEERTFDFPLVVLSALPPLLAGMYLSGGEGFVSALSISGSYGTPILYGIIPVLLAFNQRKELMNWGNDNETKVTSANVKQLAPGGAVGLGILGTGAMALISHQFVSDVSNLI